MALTTRIKDSINRVIGPINLKVETLTREHQEAARIDALTAVGHFAEPAFPLPPGLAGLSLDGLVEQHQACAEELRALMAGGRAPGHYDPANPFFPSPDAEILYLMVRWLSPRRILEVGSGNSTRIVRQAISDGGLSVAHCAIDPAPRADVEDAVDRLLRAKFEHLDVAEEIAALGAGDILFIDSSHEVRVGSDVVRLFCNVIPALAEGVVVHVHDVFLPFDYPQPICSELGSWGEQYMLQLLLQGGGYEVLWPGYYLQKCRPEAADRLPFLRHGRAQSFWFRVGGAGR